MEAVVEHVEEEQKPELDHACHLVVSVLDFLLRRSNATKKHVLVSAGYLQKRHCASVEYQNVLVNMF